MVDVITVWGEEQESGFTLWFTGYWLITVFLNTYGKYIFHKDDRKQLLQEIKSTNVEQNLKEKFPNMI